MNNLRDTSCKICGSIMKECKCMLNKCILCGEPVGNITHTICDKCQPSRPNERNVKNWKLPEDYNIIKIGIKNKKIVIVDWEDLMKSEKFTNKDSKKIIDTITKYLQQAQEFINKE